MSRRPPPNSINRSVLNNLNDRENLRKIIKSREFNLERQKELKKIIKETTENLIKAQKKKSNNLKKNRGKNLRGEYKINDALKRRYERGERRYKPGEEPRIYGDPAPAPAPAGGGAAAPMSAEDRQLKRDELAQQLQIENRKLEFQEGQELAAIDYRNRLAELQELKLNNERDMRAEENEIRRLELEGRREDVPFVNVGNEQFFNNLLSGVATEQQRGREHTEKILHELLEHNRRTQGTMGADIIEELFKRGRETGLRPPSEPASLPPNPAPPNVIILGDRPPPPYPGSEIASRVRSILSEPVEGSVGAITELERELNRDPIPEENTEDLVQRFLDTNSETHGGLGFGDNISESNLSEQPPGSDDSGERFNRLVDEAEAVWSTTAEGLEQARRDEEARESLPDFLLVDNPLAELELTESEAGRLDEQARERDRSELGTLIEGELQDLREQQIATDRLNELENQVEEEQVEEGAGVGLVEQAGQAVGGALVGAADIGLRAAGGVLQGAGEAIAEQLPAIPTAGEVGAAAGRALVGAGGAALQGAAGLVAGAAEQLVGGGGRIEEVIEDIPQEGLDIDDETLLEEVPIANRNPAEIEQENADFDYGEFISHHAVESSRRGRPPILQEQLGAKYSISNVSDREHKKLAPGQKVDITSYGSDTKGDTIGYFGIGGGVSGGEGKRRESRFQLKALDKSIQKGFLKLHKNY